MSTGTVTNVVTSAHSRQGLEAGWAAGALTPVDKQQSVLFRLSFLHIGQLGLRLRSVI